MTSFSDNRKFIENEFENAKFDTSTGLSAKELFDILSEKQASSEGKQRQIFCAETYAFVLDNVQLEINEKTPFSVKLNLGINYSYFASSDVYAKTIFEPQREKILKEKFPEDFGRMTDGVRAGVGAVWTDFWHTVPDWNRLIKLGFCGILENAEEEKEKMLLSKEQNEGKMNFLDSVIICYKAILRLLGRIYEYSLSFNVPEFSACIKNLISNPPRTLYEVMQFAILYLYVEEIGCERGRTLGPIDRLYYPFCESDLKNGKSLDEIKELFRYFFIHFTATKRMAQQPFVICGGDEKGNDFTNDLSRLILDVYDEMDIYDPKIHIRYHENLDERIFMKALDMIRGGHSSICMINDKAVFDGYQKLNIPLEDAKDYVLLGCYEPIIMGKEEGEIAISWINTVKCLEFALNGGYDPLSGMLVGEKCKTDIESFEEFCEIFIKQLDRTVDFAVDFAERQGEFSTLVNPSPIYSSSFSECIEQGKDVHQYPLKYNNMSFKCFGIATVIDSLTAIKKFVFDRKTVSLDEMRGALKSDWVGYEDLREKILSDEDKYGNNMECPDKIMCDVLEHLADRYCGKKLKRGGVLRVGLDSIDWCVQLAKKTGATPDGRRCGDAISRNLCPTNSMDRGGITAYMQSVLKIDSASYINSAIFDYTMHPTAVEGEKGLADYASLIRIFFKMGGFAAQGNIVTDEMLRDAQANPEKYSTLQVRVCGWNEYFVKLSREKQNMFIKQCEVRGR